MLRRYHGRRAAIPPVPFAPRGIGRPPLPLDHGVSGLSGTVAVAVPVAAALPVGTAAKRGVIRALRLSKSGRQWHDKQRREGEERHASPQ